MALLKQTTFLAAVSVVVTLLTVSQAVPLDVSDDAEDIKRSMVFSRLLGARERLGNLPAMMADRQLRQFAGLAPYSEQKRQRPSVQSRSGGMSLCLWKVCPAAPWLVSKRESSDYQ